MFAWDDVVHEMMLCMRWCCAWDDVVHGRQSTLDVFCVHLMDASASTIIHAFALFVDFISCELNWPSLSEIKEGTKFKKYHSLGQQICAPISARTSTRKYGATRPNSRNPQNYNSFQNRIETFRKSVIPSTISIWNKTLFEERNITFAKSIMKTKNKNPKLLLTYKW